MTSVDQKLLRQTKFPAEFNQKVDMKKVNLEVIKKWIAGRISEVLGFEDDVVTELCFSLLEGSQYPNIKALQIQLMGFLDKSTPEFCKELWTLCLSAQANPQGVPQSLLEAKKLEIIQQKIEAEKAAEAARKRRDEERAKERDVDAVRQRERSDRGRGGDRGRGRGGYDNRYSDNPPQPHATSTPATFDVFKRPNYIPPRRRDSDYRRSPPRGGGRDYRRSPPRQTDTYIPRGGRQDRRRSPSPYRAHRPRSRSPPPRARKRNTSSRSSTPAARPARASIDRSSLREPGTRGTGRNRNDRGDERTTHNSKGPSRSRSPRNRRLRSPSPDRARFNRNRNGRLRSPENSRSRSPSPRRNRRRSPRYSRSPSHSDDERNRMSANPRKGPSHSRGRDQVSPRRENAKRRRGSMERYDGRAKRQKDSPKDDEMPDTPVKADTEEEKD